ncbi:Protein arginine N-methyltransferase protein [Raphanus sativus]|nr:Protein arginine N-methyltransferase protein [Raphanus sativus]
MDIRAPLSALLKPLLRGVSAKDSSLQRWTFAVNGACVFVERSSFTKWLSHPWVFFVGVNLFSPLNHEKDSKEFCDSFEEWRNNALVRRSSTVSASKSKFDDKIEASSAKMYFHFYGQLLHQQNMLQDYVRTAEDSSENRGEAEEPSGFRQRPGKEHVVDMAQTKEGVVNERMCLKVLARWNSFWGRALETFPGCQ